MDNREGTWVLLGEYGSELEATLDLGALETADVPVLIQGREPGIFGPGFTGAMPRGVRLFVPSSCLELAREVIGEEADPGP